jgi:hypothetical protein
MFSKILTAAVVTVSLVASANGFAEHSWNGFHWEQDESPVDLFFIDSLSEQWWDQFDQSLFEWDKSVVLSPSVIGTDQSDVARANCLAEQGAIRVCNYTYGTTGWLGITTVGLSGTGHIDRATVKINDSYSGHWNDVALKNHVMCHEIGHTFGLGHTSENGSSQGTCMDYSSSLSSQWPNAHDYELLEEIYGHTHDGGGEPPPDPEPDPDDGGGNGKGKPDKGDKPGKGNGRNKFITGSPPMGIMVVSNGKNEVWVSPRIDGGMWVHQVLLVSAFD